MSSRVINRNPLNGSSLPPFDPAEIRPEFRSPVFWERETPRFKAFAQYLLLKYRFRGRRGLPPGGDEAGDYVVRAVILIFDGVRHCSGEVSSVSFVFGVIASLILNDSRRLEARTPHSFITTSASDEGEIGEDAVAVSSSEEEIIARDLTVEFIRRLPEALQRYVRLLAGGGPQSSQDCATALGVSIDEIRNMNKRLRRLRPLWKGTPAAIEQDRQKHDEPPRI
jgi:DNA-directed RNA polymerase specialized sigma24 family protein